MALNILKNYNIENIIIKKPEKITDKITIFNVKYNENEFLIQTPKFFIPDNPNIYSHNNRNFCNLKVIAHNYKFENNTQNFIEKIEKIDNFISEQSSKFYDKIKQKKPQNIKFINSFYFNKTRTKAHFYFNLQINKNKPMLSVYDWKKQKQDIDYIIPNCYGYSLLWLQNIWIKSNKIGINWVIIQMKIYYPILKIDECLIEDEDKFEFNNQNLSEKNSEKKNLDQNKIKYKDHTIFGKFFKMKKYKVPIQSIKQKLILENIDPDIILHDEEEYISETNPNKENLIKYKDHNIYGKFFKMKRIQIPIECIQHKMISENIDSNIILRDENDFVENNIIPKLNELSFLSNINNIKLNNFENNKFFEKNINNVKKIIKDKDDTLKPPTLSEILVSKRSFKKLNRNLW